MNYNILAINTGSTSDDIGYYRGQTTVFEVKIEYSAKDLLPYANKNVTEMAPLKEKIILSRLKEYGVDLKEINVVMGRGGLTKPTPGGIYYINDLMVEDLRRGALGMHPCNLGGILARSIAQKAGCISLITDPEVTDELLPEAKLTGMPEIKRMPIFHALSQRRVAYLTAEKINKPYEKCRFVIMHCGGGVTVGAHVNGQVIDVNNGLDAEGPMTPQRSGSLPPGLFAKLCYSGKYTKEEMNLKVRGHGGLYAYTGTHDVKEICSFIKTGVKAQGSHITCTQQEAKAALDAMIYQFAKYIAYMAGAAQGNLDAVILTGAVMYDDYIRETLTQKVSWLGPVFAYPGSNEKAALKEAAVRALQNPAIIKEYK